MEGYEAKIVDSSRELKAKERLMVKDFTDAVKLNQAIAEGKDVIIEPAMWAKVAVHNENSDNKDYEVLVIIDTNGAKYTTSSPTFADSFTDIWSEMSEEAFSPDTGEFEPFLVKCYGVKSKSQQGKFLTCSIV